MPVLHISASQCPSCKRIIHPPRDICPFCGPKVNRSLVVQLKNSGRIVSYTTINMPPEGFASPVQIALVELERKVLVLCMNNKTLGLALEIGKYVNLSLDAEQRLVIDSVK